MEQCLQNPERKPKDRTKTLSDMQTLVDSYVREPPITLELPFYTWGNSHTMTSASTAAKTGIYPGFFSQTLRGRPQFQEM